MVVVRKKKRKKRVIIAVCKEAAISRCKSGMNYLSEGGWSTVWKIRGPKTSNGSRDVAHARASVISRFYFEEVCGGPFTRSRDNEGSFLFPSSRDVTGLRWLFYRNAHYAA